MVIIHIWMPHLISSMEHRAVCGSYYVHDDNTTTDSSRATCRSCLKLIKDIDKLKRRAEKLVKEHLRQEAYLLNANINRVADLIKGTKLNKDQVIEAYNRAVVHEIMDT